jgi:hypothetical protein
MLFQEKIFYLCVFEIRGIFRAEAIVYVKDRNFIRNADNRTDKSSKEIVISKSIVPVRYCDIYIHC